MSEQQITEYLQAVGDYAVAFEIAEKDARRPAATRRSPRRSASAWSGLSSCSRSRVDESATQAERNVAYKRVREELDGLILLSDDAVTVLEKQVAKEISAPETATPEPERMPLPLRDEKPRDANTSAGPARIPPLQGDDDGGMPR